MKYKAKIIQIIKEEDKDNYGLRDYPNHDYLNLQPLEVWEESEKPINQLLSKLMVYFLYIGGGIIMIGSSLYMFKLTNNNSIGLIGLGLIIIPLIGIRIYEDIKSRKVFNKYWYFDGPFPVEKPHNLKLNDVLEIDIKLKKVINH